MSSLMTFTEYAAHRGCSQPNVSRAVKAGHLVDAIVLHDGQRLIDCAVADEEWPAVRGRTRIKPDVASGQTMDSETTPASRQHQPARPPQSVTQQLAKARAEREAHEAQIADMRRRKMAGELVDRDQVEAASFKSSRMTRDLILGIPAKLAPELATLDDAWEVERAMDASLRQVLEDVSRVIEEDVRRVLSNG